MLRYRCRHARQGRDKSAQGNALERGQRPGFHPANPPQMAPAQRPGKTVVAPLEGRFDVGNLGRPMALPWASLSGPDGPGPQIEDDRPRRSIPTVEKFRDSAKNPRELSSRAANPVRPFQSFDS
jgi:hypothetical protein